MFTPNKTPRPVTTELWQCSYSVDGDDLIDFATRLQEAIALYGADALELSTDYEDPRISLFHNRKETPEEVNNRIKQAKLDWERNKEYRRTQFENLKKEFSNEP